MINRRNLVGAGALGLAGAVATFANPKSGAALSGPAISRSRRRFNMVTTWPKACPALAELPNGCPNACSRCRTG